MEQREPWAPNIFPPGTEPDNLVGYELTDDGWRPMDAAREAELIRERMDEADRGEGITHEQVMAELNARREARQAASAK